MSIAVDWQASGSVLLTFRQRRSAFVLRMSGLRAEMFCPDREATVRLPGSIATALLETYRRLAE